MNKREICDQCGGTGVIIVPKGPKNVIKGCPKCNGKGTIDE